MFKIVKTFQTNKFLKNNVRRQFANYCDAGKYHYLDKLNYIGNRGIYWTHPQSSYITRITDDYDQCLRGNQSDDKTCWWYFPKKIRTVMENDFCEQDIPSLESEIRTWKFIQNAPKKDIDWYTATARCFSYFSEVSTEQKIFAAKQYACTFYTDDAIETLSSNQNFNSAATELLNNFGLVFNQEGDRVTDMSKFKGGVIPDSYIRKAIEAIEIQKELVRLARLVLKPKIFDFFLRGCCHYLSGITAEKVLFQQHCPTKTIINEEDGQYARHRSIGFKWILPTMMTDDTAPIHLNHQNPAVDLAVTIAILENDVVGYFKDKSVDFSPMTHFDVNSSSKYDLAAARIIAHRANEMKKAFVYVWENVPPENAKHYEYLAKYVGFLSDFNFVLGLGCSNFRYGWIPQED